MHQALGALDAIGQREGFQLCGRKLGLQLGQVTLGRTLERHVGLHLGHELGGLFLGPFLDRGHAAPAFDRGGIWAKVDGRGAVVDALGFEGSVVYAGVLACLLQRPVGVLFPAFALDLDHVVQAVALAVDRVQLDGLFAQRPSRAAVAGRQQDVGVVVALVSSLPGAWMLRSTPTP